MKVAVQGCAHGELENIYDTIDYIEKQNNITIDLLLCCGDFQATRNLHDLESMAVPLKFRSLCTFYKYYSGEKLAPKLTIFVGGNHEASNYLQELPYGGWVAPNIYYMGYAGVVNVGGLRIAGISGIFKGNDYLKGRYEKPPYNDETLRSCYHVRNLDIFRLKQLTQPIHIMLSHDWPAGIANYGNLQQLLKKKPYFKEEIESDTLGNKPAAELLELIQPDYWFSAHLHIKFAALFKHNAPETKSTKFLALDKCLPRRNFLQILDIPTSSNNECHLTYDLEWLAILHLTNHLLSIKKLNCYMPGPNSAERWKFTPNQEELDLVLKKFDNDLKIPKNFVPTAPPYDPNTHSEYSQKIVLNPQTVEFCEKLSVDDPILLLLNEGGIQNNSSLELSNFESSTFIGLTDSEDLSSSISEKDLPELKSFVRTPLKLPQPNFETPENIDKCVTSTPIEKAELSSSEATSTPTTKLSSDEFSSVDKNTKEEDSLAPGPKKFRRRNVALYASNDED